MVTETYARGLSTRHVEDAIRDATGELLISTSAVSAITDQVWADYPALALSPAHPLNQTAFPTTNDAVSVMTSPTRASRNVGPRQPAASRAISERVPEGAGIGKDCWMANDDSGCFWWHSIRMADGSVTPGEKTPDILQQEWQDLSLPPVSAKTVLDIGAWDGWFSFEAERASASRVVALDQYVWALDFSRSEEYWEYVAKCRAAGQSPDAWGPECAWWDAETLPGKRAFDKAHRSLGSAVESINADFMTYDLDSLGTFDIVLFLGVLYHLKEPLTALERLRRTTKSLAIVETAAISLPDNDQRPIIEFLPEGEPNGDTTNWYLPNEAAVHAMLKRAKFSDTKTVARSFMEETRSGVTDFRLTVHAIP